MHDLFDHKGVNNSRSISTRACACYNQGICDPYTGSCICPSGFLGRQCEQAQCKITNTEYPLFCIFYCLPQRLHYVIMLFAETAEYAIYSHQLFPLVGVC